MDLILNSCSQFHRLKNQVFHVRTAGPKDAPALLFLHGFPEYSGAWAEVVAALSDDYRCIAPDQRGYGLSYCPPSGDFFAMQHLVADMAALIADLGTPVTVIGHDWGASVAYGLAMFRPELVSRLIILNGVHPVPFQKAMASGGAQSAASQYINTLRAAGSEDRLAAKDFAGLLKLFSAEMDLSWLTPDRQSAYLTEWRRPGRLKAMIDWYRASPLVVADPGKPIALPDFPTDKLRVRCPHLLIWGANDTALLPESTEGLETFAPDLTRVTLPDVDHWLHHQQPAKVAQTIRDWLA